MKRFFLSFLAIFFPWLALLLLDNPGGALVALVLQCTIIGWIPATIWAWNDVQRATRQNKRRQKYQAKQKKSK